MSSHLKNRKSLGLSTAVAWGITFPDNIATAISARPFLLAQEVVQQERPEPIENQPFVIGGVIALVVGLCVWVGRRAYISLTLGREDAEEQRRNQ